jgi:outer membrane protein OmpA-like peptidoglycan-associated protein
MKIRHIIIVAVLITAPLKSSANFFGNLKAELDTMMITLTHKQADKKFEGLAYAKAIEKYEKLVEKGFAPDSLRRNLALSYLKVNRTKESEVLYSELVANSEAGIMDVYYYAQALKYNQKYDEADKWIEEYRRLKQEDTRGELQYEAAPVIKEIYSKEKYTIEPVYFNSEFSEFGAIVEGDQVVFTSGRNNQAIIQYEYSWKGSPYLDVFHTPVEKPALYKEPTIMSKGINSRFHDGPICYSPDGSEVFITRNNFHYGMPKYSEDKENHFKLYVRKKESDKWSEVEELPFNSTEYSCGHPAISADNSTLYFASDMPGGIGGSDIYYSVRTNDGWSEPVNMGADINTEGDEMFPFISGTDEFYFASNGHLGLGGLDIFMAEKTTEGTYGILNMGYPLNSSADDFSFYLLPNGWDGYFASNREGGKGDDDIYKFTMLDKPSFSLTLIGTSVDAASGEILANADVHIKDSDGKVLFSGKSDSNGQVQITGTPGSYYKLTAAYEKYTDANMNVLADKNKAEEDVFKFDIPLSLIQEWGVFGFIFEKESGTGVQGVDITIFEKGTENVIADVTDAEGNFRKLLKPETDYDILLKKKKFFTRRGEFSTKGMEPGWIDVKEFIEVEMEEIVVGKTIEIPNIYYDLGKWNIREDAAVELDKVVQFLKDNETITIELGSHTDARGSKSSNQTLSQKRAESAVNYIVTNGIDQSRISARGYGEERLKNRCADGVRCSEDEHQENRRTEIKIVSF